MSVTDMLKYHDMLSVKAEEARKSGRQNVLDSVLKRMDAIWVMIDAAFLYTTKEAMPQIAQLIDVKLFDFDLLKLVLGPAKFKNLPVQGKINFEVVEETQETSRVPRTNLAESLAEILKRNFVEQIPLAIRKYREVTGSKEPDSIAWINIRNTLGDVKMMNNWDRVITNKLISAGPVVAFQSVKKHLMNWSDMDIAILIDDATQRAAKLVPTEEEKQTLNNRTFNVLDSFRKSVRDYVNDDVSVSALKSLEPIEDKTRVGQRMSEIAKYLSPSTRVQMLARKEYIEKGY